MKTPFYGLHIKYGAKIVNFHGWDMPLQYFGIVQEHINTRQNVSIFDVSHMGRFEIKGAGAFESLQALATNDLSRLNDNQALYSPMCYEDGGIVDDLIIYRINSQRFLVVVNASNRTKDFQWIASHSNSSLEDISDATALVAIQGPRASQMLERALPTLGLAGLKPFDLIKTNILDFRQPISNKKEKTKNEIKEERGEKKESKDNNKKKEELIISRTGYTGEDGFELIFDSSQVDIWEKLMQIGTPFNIKPAGLGARDTLRLEAGLMLYGNDMNETTTPLEVPLRWTVKLEKPSFVGKQALETRPITKKLVGFEVHEKRIARHGNKVFIDRQPSGHVTSGGYAPTLRKSIGFCFVPPNVPPGQLIEIEIGGKMYKAKIASTTRFYRRK
jgi:aminomethyltransferase